MIAKLTGRLDSSGAGHAVIDVGGVGYLVEASARTLDALGPVGGDVTIHTEMLVGEDFLRLLGFARAEERDWFRLLTSVQGVGAKVALAILSALEVTDLQRALASGDSAMIARANGVGPKLAQRIAHEIKNPLTPIQLSVQRLAKHLERQATANVKPPEGEVNKLIGECAALIEREVSTLKSLVDEFSQFARFPAPRPINVVMNEVVQSALAVFAGRLDHVRLHTALAGNLPLIKADPEMLRRVLVNLIDNAAEAMEGASIREMTISTRLASDGGTIEIMVADSGHGISPEDKNKLFLPRFSTRSRGTGLGLAIAGRIVAEHHGTIRVEDNLPTGAKFLIRLPVMLEAQAQAQQAATQVN